MRMDATHGRLLGWPDSSFRGMGLRAPASSKQSFWYRRVANESERRRVGVGVEPGIETETRTHARTRIPFVACVPRPISSRPLKIVRHQASGEPLDGLHSHLSSSLGQQPAPSSLESRRPRSIWALIVHRLPARIVRICNLAAALDRPYCGRRQVVWPAARLPPDTRQPVAMASCRRPLLACSQARRAGLGGRGPC